MGGGASKVHLANAEAENASLVQQLAETRKQAAEGEQKAGREKEILQQEASERAMAASSLAKELMQERKARKEVFADFAEEVEKHAATAALVEEAENKRNEVEQQFDHFSNKSRAREKEAEVREEESRSKQEAELRKIRKAMKRLRVETVHKARLAFESTEAAKARVFEEHSKVVQINDRLKAADNLKADLERSVRRVNAEKALLLEELSNANAALTRFRE